MKAARHPPTFEAGSLLEEIRSWVEIESPTTDAAALNRMMDKVQADAGEAGAQTCRIPGRDGFGDHLMVSSPWDRDEPGILVLSHLDTVHAVPCPFASRATRLSDRASTT